MTKFKNTLALILFISLFLGCKIPSKNISLSSNRPPNIIFIMSDDHSYQTLSAYDDTYLQTPNLDRIANEGVLFENSLKRIHSFAPSFNPRRATCNALT